jgi:NitT/TauT family transport system permease protein
LALFSVIWELSGRLFHYAFLPPLSKVLIAGYELTTTGQILGNLLVSIVSLIAGYGLAACLGVLVGTLMGRFRKVEYFLDIYLSVFLASPSLIYAPVLFALFGVSRLTQTAIVFMSSFFVVVANTMTAIRSVDSALLEMGRSFGATKRQLFWKILLPSSLPMIMAGLRLGMARAFKGMISGEMYIALIGLGALLRLYGSRFQADRVLAILLIVVALAVFAMGLIEILDRYLNRWKR